MHGLRNLLVGFVAVLIAMVPNGAIAAEERQTYLLMPAAGAENELRSALRAIFETPEETFAAVDNLLVIDLLPSDAAALAANPAVGFIELDQPVSISGTQSPSPSWGLDRVDGKLDGSFTYPDSAGAGVLAYVFDTGVDATHPDLAGRVFRGFDVIGNNAANTDCHFHGTHVAGTIAGTAFGVAKEASIVPLRVLNCFGSGSYAGVIRAINWVIATHPSGVPAVANLSLGGPRSSAVNFAIAAMVEAGISTYVAAGNSYADACNTSPASTPEAITVGATDRFDNKAGFSNFGDCVDVFGPGVGIVSANAKNHAAPTALSGTSMAAPHLAGIGALILGQNPDASASQVENQIYQLSLPGAVGNSRTVRGNRLAQSPSDSTVGIPTLPGAPAGLRVTEVAGGEVSFAWNEVAGATSYLVESRKESHNVFTRSTVLDPEFTVRDLGAAELAFVRVSAVSTSGPSAFGPTVSARSLAQAPSAPLNPVATPSSQTATVISWTAPISSGGAGLVRYVVEENLGAGWARITSTTNTSVSLAAMSSARSYRIIATNTVGSSAPSSEVAFDPARVFTITNLTATQRGGTAADISWSSNAPAGSTFEVTILRTGQSSPVAVRRSQGTELSIPGLSRLTTYQVQVVSLTEIRGVQSQTTFSTGASIPSAPRSQSAVRTPDGFRVSFSVPSDNGGEAILGYRLEKLVGSSWSSESTGPKLSFIVAAPARGESVDYRLIAVNSVGDSLPSNLVRVTTPGAAPSAPTNVIGSVLEDGKVRLDWSSPIDLGGSPVSSYRVEVLRNGVWSALGTVAGTLTSYMAPTIAKGSASSYRLSASNRFGTSQRSDALTVERRATVPGAVGSLSVAVSTSQISFRWMAPGDNGGSALLGYQLQVKTPEGWELVAELSTVLTHAMEPGTPGLALTYRVVAVNEVGASELGAERLVTMPFQAPSAPSNLTVLLEGGSLVLAWEAPERDGGSPLSFYAISTSVDGGPFRQTSTVRASQLLTRIPSSNKGLSVSFRVQAVATRGGVGLASETVSIDVPATAPADPQRVAAQQVVGAGVRVSWTTPTNNGGKPISGYRVESRVGSAQWTLVEETSAIELLAPLPRAGEVVSYRVLAINEIGSSTGSRFATVRMNVAPATAPLSLSSQPISNSALLSWSAPETMGGSFFYYLVEFSDGGEFRRLSSTRSLTLTTSMPAANQTRVYRVAAFTNAGLGAWSDSYSITAPKTIPGAPNSLRLTSNANEVIATWQTLRVPTGGVELLTAALYFQSAEGLVKVAEAPVGDLRLVLPNALHGETHSYSLRFTNEVGESASGRATAFRHALAPAGPVTQLTAAQEGSSVRLSWSSPEFIGGSPVRFAEIQSSSDGVIWNRISTIRYAENTLVRSPAKGQSLQYRVIARNNAGSSQPSSPVSFTSPLTVASSDFSVFASRAGNQLQFRINSPSDFGGYERLTVLIERSGTLAWQSSAENVLTRPRTLHTFNLELPAARGTYLYRVSVMNPSGEVERIHTFRY